MKKFVIGLITGIVLSVAITSAADSIWEKIDVLRNDISVVVDGNKIKSDNFLYNDTTYLPLRAISEALGKEVTYDEETNTANIQTPKDSTTPTTTPNNGGTNMDRPLDGMQTIISDEKIYVDCVEIERKYKGDYYFALKDDDTYCIRWREIFFETYPQSVGGDPTIEWYNTVLLPWLQSEGWKNIE